MTTKKINTDSMDILTAIISEQELGVSNSSYSIQKMKFLVDHLPDNEQFYKEQFVGVYLKIWYILKHLKFDISNDDRLSRAIKASDITWDLSGVKNCCKKMQKQLEIIWLYSVNSDSDTRLQNIDAISEYNKIFKGKSDISINNIIKRDIEDKRKRAITNMIYNDEAKKIKKYFRSVMKDYSDIDPLDAMEIIRTYRRNNTIKHMDLNKRIDDVFDTLIRCNNRYIDENKRKEVTFNQMERLCGINKRKLINIDTLVTDKQQHYRKKIEELNRIYGYERFTIKEE